MAEAQATVDRSQEKYRDFEGQTRQLFNYMVDEDTKEDQNRRELNAKAFEEMNDQEAKLLFNPDTAFFDNLAGDLLKYVEPMRQDPALQRKVAQLQGHITGQMLVKMSKSIFKTVGDVWTGILTIFTIGLELCRQAVIDLYDTIADAITFVITEVGADWILNHGGWSKALQDAHGWFGSMAEGLKSWFSGSSATTKKD